jgi:DNA-binding NarL/FixJ family response regulator
VEHVTGESESQAPIRVLLVDDHPVVRRGLAALLGTLPGIEVVGEAGDGSEAVKEAQLSRPDVVVMDVQMPGVDGVEATKALHSAVPSAAVLVLTMFEDAQSVVMALRAGAKGYLLKGADQDEIVRAIRAVAAGDTVLGKPVAAQLVGSLDRTGTSRAPGEPAWSDGSGAPPGPFPDLTRRETEILDHIAAGRSNTDIASSLGLAGKTVSNHISAIFAKLRVASRSEAIVAARDAGLGRR